MLSKDVIRTENFKFSIVYGNTAEKLKNPINGCTHSWKLYVKPFREENISYFVKKVRFELDKSYNSPIRVLTKEPFEIREFGYAEFNAVIKLYLKVKPIKVVTLKHKVSFYKSDKNDLENYVFVKELHKEIEIQDSSKPLNQSLLTKSPHKMSLQNEILIQKTSQQIHLSKFDQKRLEKREACNSPTNLGK